ncbi:hypothetical protein GX48_03229 [Paracoccidioides brasiliensis]|nr:hypothetical protein GX48_03229 [Paracoccidioides brasiliensis]
MCSGRHFFSSGERQARSSCLIFSLGGGKNPRGERPQAASFTSVVLAGDPPSRKSSLRLHPLIASPPLVFPEHPRWAKSEASSGDGSVPVAARIPSVSWEPENGKGAGKHTEDADGHGGDDIGGIFGSQIDRMCSVMDALVNS